MELDTGTQEFENDRDYFRWLAAHPMGYVLSVRGREYLLHTTACAHIDRHNNPGALTERGSRKVCADSKTVLREWVKSSGLGPGIPLPKCPSCS